MHTVISEMSAFSLFSGFFSLSFVFRKNLVLPVPGQISDNLSNQHPRLWYPYSGGFNPYYQRLKGVSSQHPCYAVVASVPLAGPSLL